MVVQEAQRHRVLVGVDPLEAGAADHDVDLVLAHVGPQAVPEQLHGALVAIGLQHARAAELHEAIARRAGGDQRGDVVLALRVEAVRADLRHLLAQHAVGADDAVAAAPGPGADVLAGDDVSTTSR